VEIENWVATTRELASEVMQSFEDTKRPRYSEKPYHFTLTLANYSVTGYQLLRKAIPLPSLQSLHSKFRNVKKARESQLSCVGNLHALLTDLLEMDECDHPAVLVAVDVISVSNTFVRRCGMTRETESHMFLLGLQPIHPCIPCGPIHVLGPEVGNVNQFNSELIR
jgi:hypothetical protein